MNRRFLLFILTAFPFTLVGALRSLRIDPSLLQHNARDTLLFCAPQSIFEDEEELRGIATKYLVSKYKGCVGNDCRFQCDRSEVRAVLRSVLPPLSPAALERELELFMAKFRSQDEVIAEEDFLAAFIENSYWREAGSLVVKELIYLDCLQSFYAQQERLLEDDDFDALKDMLVWEGSSAATLSSKEARFISGIAAHRRGAPIMSDAEYQTLKDELQRQNSWVATRGLDPLEKLGLDTFMGYLHRQKEEE